MKQSSSISTVPALARLLCSSMLIMTASQSSASAAGLTWSQFCLNGLAVYESIGIGFSCYCDDNTSSINCQRYTQLNNFHSLSLIYDDDTQSYSFAAECICETSSCDAFTEITSCYGYTPGPAVSLQECNNPSSSSCSICETYNGFDGFVALQTPELGCTQTFIVSDEASFLLPELDGDGGSADPGGIGTDQSGDDGNGVNDFGSGAISNNQSTRYFYLWMLVAAASSSTGILAR